ncbi:MAG: hypothetical protein V1770_04445 [bacterium]
MLLLKIKNMTEDLAKFISLLLILLLFGLALILANTNFVLAASSSSLPSQHILLVKSLNSPIVYSIIHGKKLKIPNEETFSDYGYKWEDIKILSEQEISLYPDLKLVKTENNPTVYYINSKKGIKKAHPSAQVFLDYGNKWEDIRTISEKNLSTYKDALLVKAYNEPAVYKLENNIRKVISSTIEFENIGYKWEDIIEISQLDLESYNLSSEKIQAANVSQNENNVSTTTEKKQLLNISISNLSQANFIAAGTIGEFFELNLESMQDTVAIDGITISAHGVIKDSDVGYVYIIDKDDSLFNFKSKLYGKKTSFIFNEPLIITEKERRNLIIKASINKGADTSYRTIGFGIDNAGDIMTDAVIYGSFPMKGMLKEMRDVDGVLGSVKITYEKLNFAQINTGAKNQKIASFIIEENSGNEDVLIQKISFYARGNVKNTDIINIDLLNKDRKILSTVVWMQTDGKVEFDLTKNPLRISKNTKETISLQADIIGIGDKNFEFIIKDSADIQIIGANSLVELITTLSSGDGTNNLTVKKGSIFAYINEDSPEGLIAGTKNATLAIFDFKSMNTDVALKSFNLTISQIGTPLDGDISIINAFTGKEIYAISRGSAEKGAIELNIDPQKIALGSYLQIKIQTDIPENIASDTAYSVTLDKFGFDDLQNELYIIKFQEISSGMVAVKKSALYITPEAIGDSYVAGSDNVLLGAFTLQANYSEDIYIDYVSIKSLEGYNEVNSATGFYNFRLNLGNTENNAPLTVPIGFIFKSPYKISAGKSITLKIYADTYPTVSGNNIALTLLDINAYGKDSKSEPKVEGLNKNSTPITFSKIDLSLTNNENFTTSEVGCGKEIKIGSFKFKALSEDIYVKELTLKTSSQSDLISYQNNYSNLKIKNGSKTLASLSKPLPEFNVLKTSFKVEKDKEIIIDVYIDIPECCDCDERYLQIAMEGISSYGYTSKVAPESKPSATSNMLKVVCECED